jgi:subtilisin family serine protease
MKGPKTMCNLAQVKLRNLMSLTCGTPDIKIGLIDGPIALDKDDLANARIHEISGKTVACTRPMSPACSHGTFVAGMLSGKRGVRTPAICPNCTLLARPIFSEETILPSASPDELASAILDCIKAGARIINMSIVLAHQSRRQKSLEDALNYAIEREVIIVAATGNDGTLGSSIITKNPWVIPVAACNTQGRPMERSNLGSSLGKRGLMAPGDKIRSLKANGGYVIKSGTSFAAPYVSGTIGLLWSLFPDACAVSLRSAVLQSHQPRRSIIPPLLDAERAYQFMANNSRLSSV